MVGAGGGAMLPGVVWLLNLDVVLANWWFPLLMLLLLGLLVVENVLMFFSCLLVEQ